MTKNGMLIIIGIMLLVIAPALSAEITPTLITWHSGGSTNANLSYDGNTATKAEGGSGAANINFTFSSGNTISSCELYTTDNVVAGGRYINVRPDGTLYWNNNTWRQFVLINTWTTFTFPEPVSVTSLYAGVSDGGWQTLNEIKFYGTPATVPQTLVNFTGTPLDGYNPLEVNFTISNFTGVNSTPVTWIWGDGSSEAGNTSTITHTYQNPGIYTVILNYFNVTGNPESITKTNYVLASLPSGMIVNLDVKNAITGALIQDSTVSIRNVSTGVWRNTTAPTGLVYFSTTDPGYLYPLSLNQTITLAANKSGYYDASDTFAIPYNNYRARLFLMPTSVTNATGAGTVVVNVVRNKDGLTVSGMSVVMDTGQIGVTNSAGAVTLYNVTAGDRVVKVTDPDGAYQDTEKSFSLTAGETELIVVQVVLDGESPVDVPVTPTTTTTFDPSDPSSYGEYGNYTAPQMNEAGGFVILQMLGQLFSLWPLVVMGIFFKFMKSAFS